MVVFLPSLQLISPDAVEDAAELENREQKDPWRDSPGSDSVTSILLREEVVVGGRSPSSLGGRHRTVLVTEYARTQCTDVARFLTLNSFTVHACNP